MEVAVQQTENRLICPRCRNTDRFIEVMAEEAHVINGRRDYIRLFVGIVDHYACGDCGETIEAGDQWIERNMLTRS